VLDTMELLEKSLKDTMDLLESSSLSLDERRFLLEKQKALHSQLLAERKASSESFDSTAKLELEEKKLELDQKKVENDQVFSEKKLEQEERKNETEKKRNFWTAVCGVGGLIATSLGTIFTFKSYRDGLRFEQTGTYTSKTGNVLSGLNRLYKIK